MREISRAAEKLPEYLIHRWQQFCQNYKKEKDRYPKITQFADFVKDQADLANDPVIHCHRAGPTTSRVTAKVMTVNSEEFTTSSPTSRKPKECSFCKSYDHYLAKCEKFVAKPYAQREEFLRKQKRCFKCLGLYHYSRDCTRPHECGICKKFHPTCLHDRFHVANSTSPRAS